MICDMINIPRFFFFFFFLINNTDNVRVGATTSLVMNILSKIYSRFTYLSRATPHVRRAHNSCRLHLPGQFFTRAKLHLTRGRVAIYVSTGRARYFASCIFRCAPFDSISYIRLGFKACKMLPHPRVVATYQRSRPFRPYMGHRWYCHMADTQDHGRR